MSLFETEPTDANGKVIKVGAKAVYLSKSRDDIIQNGAVGEIRDIKERLTFGKRGKTTRVLHVRITRGPEGNPEWSSWSLPNQVAVID